MNSADEFAFIVDCANPDSGSVAVERIRAKLQGGINWVVVLSTAIPHGVLPLMNDNLSAVAADLCPPELLIQLKLYSETVKRRNKEQVLTLLQILSAFQNQGVRAFPFKGPTLASCAYRHYYLREFHDLDFWIHPRDLADAGELVRSLGFVPVKHMKGVPQLCPDAGKWQTEFLRTDTNSLVELHPILQSEEFSFNPSFDEVWERRGEVWLEESRIPVLPTEDLLIAVSAHGSKHLWGRLHWITDIAGLVARNPNMDCKRMFRQAARWSSTRRLLLALKLADDFFGAQIPPEHEPREYQGNRNKRLAARIRTALFEPAHTRNARNFLDGFRHHMESADTIRAKTAIAASYVRRIRNANETKMVLPLSGFALTLYRTAQKARSWTMWWRKNNPKEQQHE